MDISPSPVGMTKGCLLPGGLLLLYSLELVFELLDIGLVGLVGLPGLLEGLQGALELLLSMGHSFFCLYERRPFLRDLGFLISFKQKIIEQVSADH